MHLLCGVCMHLLLWSVDALTTVQCGFILYCGVWMHFVTEMVDRCKTLKLKSFSGPT